MFLQFPTLNWRRVLAELDFPGFWVEDGDGVKLIITAFQNAVPVRGNFLRKSQLFFLLFFLQRANNFLSTFSSVFGGTPAVNFLF